MNCEEEKKSFQGIELCISCDCCKSLTFLGMEREEASRVRQEQLKGSGWVSMYPSYVDKERSIKDGRRVKVECACMIVTGTVNNIGENPSTMDVMNACTKLGLDCLLEVGF